MNRLKPAILATCFLFAVIVLPDIDAMLYHGAPGQEQSRSHIEALGSAGCHAESCLLGAVHPDGQGSPKYSDQLARLPDPDPLPLVVVHLASDRSLDGSLRSRAPPDLDC